MLLEQAITATYSRDFNLLLKLSERLQVLSNMHLHLTRNDIPENDMELLQLRQKFCTSVFYTSK